MVAPIDTPSASGSASIVRGAKNPRQASKKMTIAATAMNTPITTAEKYSAL